MIQQSPDGVRAQVHGMWAAVARNWARHADYVDARGAQAAQALLELTRPAAGEHVLELACGTGGVGIAAAEWVGPGGEVVVSDVAAEMTALAAARAAARGVRNVTARVLDLERIDEPDCSYDVVLCREGLMFALEPAGAAGELRRVLRPGGRVALAVWGPRERNPWLALIFDAMSSQLGMPVPPPGVPGPFSLADGDRLAGLLQDAGLADVAVRELPVPLRAASFDEWWSRTSTIAGPLAQRIAALPHDARLALRARLEEATRPYATAAGLEFPGLTLIASARRT